MKKRLVIVGAGLGGLALALRAVCKGWNVCILERNSTPGGKMNILQRDGFRFDTGPSLITLPDVFIELFEQCGVNHDHLRFQRLQPLTQYRFADGERIEYPGTLPAIASMLERFEPDGGRGYWTLMATAAKLFELSSRTFFRSVPTELPSATQALTMLRALRFLPVRNAWGNYSQTVERHVASPYLRQIFNRYPTYVGSSPYRSPATLLVIPYLEFAFGGWYPEGGLYRIVETIVAALQERGVRIERSAPVTAIVHHNGRVRGVCLDSGDRIEADVVAFNGDATTVNTLLGLPHTWSIPERSMSAMVFLIGLKSRLPDDVHHHTIAFSSDYHREFEEIFEQRIFPHEPTVYLNVTSKTDPTTAPTGCETLFVMANAPALDGKPWNRDVPMVWERVCSVLERRGIAIAESDIVVRSVWTPEEFERVYAMPGGSIYGLASHSYRTAFLRPALRHRRIRGLYFVGGSTHPGGGTPMVVLSSKLVMKLIERYEVDR